MLATGVPARFKPAMQAIPWTRNGRTLFFTPLGQGTAPLGNLYAPVSDAQADAALDAAWDAGIRLFDTAPLYGLGLAETRLNRALRGRPRDDHVLCTKAGRYLEPCAPEHRTGQGFFFDTPDRRVVFDYTYTGIMRSVEHSLERLGAGRLDVLHVHDLDTFNQRDTAVLEARREDFLRSGLRAFESLRAEGVVTATGAGINGVKEALWLLERCDLDLLLLASRYTLLEQEALDALLPLCERRGVGVIVGGPFNSGILATGVLANGNARYDYAAAPPAVVERVAAIERVCAAHDVPLASAALRFPLAHPAVVAVIPGGRSAAEVAANAVAMAASVPLALWDDLKAQGLLRPDAPTPASPHLAGATDA